MQRHRSRTTVGGRGAWRRVAAALIAAALPLAAHAGEWSCGRKDGLPVLRFEGSITGGEFDRFARTYSTCFPSTYGGQQTIDLSSGGGSVDEALAIANFLVRRFRGKPPLLFTQVSPGSACISACTYLFVAGQQRDVAPGASLEPHGFSGLAGPPMRMVIALAQREAAAGKGDVIEAVMRRPQWLVRGNIIAEGLGRALAADRRLAWVPEHYGGEVQTRQDAARRLKSFADLPPERQNLILQLDAVAMSTLPELERISALQAFNAQFAIAQGASDAAPLAAIDRPEALLRWAVDGYLDAVNAFIDATKSGARLRDLPADDLRQVHEKRIGSVFNTVNGKLGPYLAERSGDIDVPAFVKLMFSTSILYTRPLTREELCDFNLVNRGCE